MAAPIETSDGEQKSVPLWHVVAGYLAACAFPALLFTLLRFVSEYGSWNTADASLWLLPVQFLWHICFLFAVIVIITLPAFMLLRVLLGLLSTKSWIGFFLAGAASAALVTFYSIPGIGYYIQGADASDFVILAVMMVAGGVSGVVAYATEKTLTRRSP